MRISRTITDTPLPVGVWCTEPAIVVAYKGSATVASRHHLDADQCREFGAALIEAADYLDGRAPAAVLDFTAVAS